MIKMPNFFEDSECVLNVTLVTRIYGRPTEAHCVYVILEMGEILMQYAFSCARR